MKKRVIITGASGNVGSQLVPILSNYGYDLLLVGRDPSRLALQFPGIKTAQYDSIPCAGANYDAMIHLAVLNNDADATLEEFQRVNSEFLLHVMDLAKQAGIPRFISFSTVHALDASNRSPYAQSKRAGTTAASAISGIELSTLYLPAVLSPRLSGKLALISHLPKRIKPFALTILKALKPTVDVDKIAKYLVQADMAVSSRSVILSNDIGSNRVYQYSKRLIDIGFSLTILVAFCWLLVVIWIAVRLDSSGPGLIAQSRVGQFSRIFTCYKFRTMRQGTRQAGTHDISAAAITQIGGFLRRSKFDELPQAWNILLGQMSLVGPRPCLPIQSEVIEERNKVGVLGIQPGITGLAQIRHIDMSDPVKLAAADLEYLCTRSLIGDLKIILKTARGGGRGDRVHAEPNSN